MTTFEELGLTDNATFSMNVTEEFSMRRRGCKYGKTKRGTCRKGRR